MGEFSSFSLTWKLNLFDTLNSACQYATIRDIFTHLIPFYDITLIAYDQKVTHVAVCISSFTIKSDVRK